MPKRKWTDEDLKKAVEKCKSIAQILAYLNLQPAGGNYLSIQQHIGRLGLKLPDRRERLGWLKGKTHTHNTRPLTEVLVDKKVENTHRLRLRLLSSGIKEHKCEKCCLTHWLNRPIPLEIHHKDGNRKNNLLDNIELLCPNCHAFTDNYRRKKKTNTAA
mgnify:CR=1 FL=1